MIEPTRWSALALLSILSLACGDDSSTPTPQLGGDAGRGADAAVPLDASSPTLDAAGPDGEASLDAQVVPSGDGGLLPLFSDEPTCSELGGKLDGEIEGTTVRVVLAPESFDVVQLELSARREDLIDSQGSYTLNWASTLYPAPSLSPLSGGKLSFPEIIGAGPYCVTAGRIALVEVAGLRESYQVEITRVRKANGDSCEGPELAASVRGCFEIFNGGSL